MKKATFLDSKVQNKKYFDYAINNQDKIEYPARKVSYIKESNVVTPKLLSKSIDIEEVDYKIRILELENNQKELFKKISDLEKKTKQLRINPKLKTLNKLKKLEKGTVSKMYDLSFSDKSFESGQLPDEEIMEDFKDLNN